MTVFHGCLIEAPKEYVLLTTTQSQTLMSGGQVSCNKDAMAFWSLGSSGSLIEEPQRVAKPKPIPVSTLDLDGAPFVNMDDWVKRYMQQQIVNSTSSGRKAPQSYIHWKRDEEKKKRDEVQKKRDEEQKKRDEEQKKRDEQKKRNEDETVEEKVEKEKKYEKLEKEEKNEKVENEEKKGEDSGKDSKEICNVLENKGTNEIKMKNTTSIQTRPVNNEAVKAGKGKRSFKIFKFVKKTIKKHMKK